MNDLRQLIEDYLTSRNVMQLATCADSQPWVCTVHYYSDNSFNLYWISTKERRHSSDIKQNQKVAAGILIHENNPLEDYVIGISVEGIAEYIGENINEQIGESYVKKLHKAPNLLLDIKSGKNPHKFYCLKPTRIVLFDNKDFPENPRQEYRV